MWFEKINMQFNGFILLQITTVFVILLSLGNLQNIEALDDEFFWEFGAYDIDRGFAGSGDINRFEIFDPGLDDNGNIDEIEILIESKDKNGKTIEARTISLTETASDDGIFGITHAIFNESETLIGVEDIILVSVEDLCDELPSDDDGNCDSEVQEKLEGSTNDSVWIYSDTTGFAGRIAIDLEETEKNSGIFSSMVRFTTTEPSDSDTATLRVSIGDIITIEDQKTGSKSNGLIFGDPTKLVIQAEIDGRVEVTYSEVTDFTDILNKPPGRGSGGAGGPSIIVVDSSGGGGNCNDCLPPTLGMNQNHDRIVDNGFSYNGNPVDVELYYTPYPLITVNVGEENLTVLKIYDDAGADNIQHVGLGFGLGKGEYFNESKATINWDKTFFGAEKVTTYDPDNVFDNVRAISEIGRCGTSVDAQCLILNIYHTFREPLDFNMVATYVWDSKRNGWQNYYNHGIHIIGESLNPPDEYEGYHKAQKYHLIETGKDTATDQNGNTWSLVKGIWERDYIPTKKIDDGVTMHGFTRDNARFDMYKLGQVLLAENTMQNQVLRGEDILNDQFYDEDNYRTIYITGGIERVDDPVLQQTIQDEMIRTELLKQEIYKFELGRNNFGTIFEVNK